MGGSELQSANYKNKLNSFNGWVLCSQKARIQGRGDGAIAPPLADFFF